MSQAGTTQKRTTYLISLTLVKVEAVPGDAAGSQTEGLPEGEGSPSKKKKEEEVEVEAEENEKEVVRDVPEKEESLYVEVEQKEKTQVEEEVEQVHERHGSTNESRDKPERREVHAPQRDIVPVSKSKDASFAQAPVRQMVKVYGGTMSEGSVRREGPRSDALRPKTELYREPPMMFLKGENGADLNSRSRCSLPFTISSQISQPPPVVMRSHSGSNSSYARELRETNTSLYHPAKTLDRRDNRLGDQSPLVAATTLGPYRASWADSDGRGTLIRPGAPISGGFSGVMARESPQGERYKAVSVSLPAPPAPDVCRPPRKGTSCTLDNSDLHSYCEDPRKVKDGQGGTIQRAPPPRDPVERGSSEEEGKASCLHD
ncbi:hypothetical protein CHARACLAT_021712 [Characodon lateralis]|uniref:Uncharacterized protein n=1 Tax=Characodon lateralis TaxID=208331 RepID=A0ABU7DTR8_9TELE|nr:hypothetical protein [Characodon lateralis]